MTWNEKIVQTNIAATRLILKGTANEEKEFSKLWGTEKSVFGNMQGHNEIKGVLFTAMLAIKNGDVDKFQSVVVQLENQLKALQLLTSVYKKYTGEKKQVRESKIYAESASSCGVVLNLAIVSGALVLTLPEEVYGNKTPEAIMLFLSRIVRDGKVRCLKHPRNKSCE